MNKILFLMALICGLIFANFNASAQTIEHYNEKNPRPENTRLEPVMFGAHSGKNFSIEEVRLAQTKGLNSHVPVEILEESDREMSRTEFRWLAEQQGFHFSTNQELDEWVQTEFTPLGAPNQWHENAFNFLGPVTAPEKIISLAYLPKDSPEADAGMKSIERGPFKRGQRNYTNEDEMFVGLQLDKLSSNPVYTGVVIPRYSLGCGNRIMAFTPPKLNLPEPRLVVDPQQPRQSYLGTNWVVVVVEVQHVSVIQQAPQSFYYCDMWMIGCGSCYGIYTPIPSYVYSNCGNCGYGGGYAGGNYGGGSNSGGNTTITNINEGDNITNIIEGDNIFVNNNNNPPTPPTPTPDPDDDGGPVNPNDPPPPHNPGSGGPVNPNDPDVPPGVGNGLALESSDSGIQNPETKKTTTSYSDLETQFGLRDTEKKVTPTGQSSDGKKSLSISEAEQWARQKEAVVAQREQQQNGVRPLTKPTNPTNQQIGNWTVGKVNSSGNSGNQQVHQNETAGVERKPQSPTLNNGENTQPSGSIGDWTTERKPDLGGMRNPNHTVGTETRTPNNQPVNSGNGVGRENVYRPADSGTYRPETWGSNTSGVPETRVPPTGSSSGYSSSGNTGVRTPPENLNTGFVTRPNLNTGGASQTKPSQNVSTGRTIPSGGFNTGGTTMRTPPSPSRNFGGGAPTGRSFGGTSSGGGMRGGSGMRVR